MELILWILALVLIVAGVLALFRRQILWGVVLIVVGLVVGPGFGVFSG
ncbi:GPGG-motif small membrane protein [Micromonospora sp. DT47]